MATTYKVLGQTTATAASSTIVVNSITDPLLDNLGNLSFGMASSTANTIVNVTGGLSTWKGTSAVENNNMIFRSATNISIAPYAGNNSLFVSNSVGGTYTAGFIFGPTTSQTTLVSSGTGNIPASLLVDCIPVSPSTTYYCGLYSYGNSGVNYNFRVKWYNSSGTYISAANNTFTPGNGTWAKNNTFVTSPGSAAYAIIVTDMPIPNGGNWGIDNAWFSTDSNASTTFPTPGLVTDSELLTAPFTSRGTNIWSGTAYASTTVTKFAGALTDVYTVPASTQAVISTLTVANLGSTDTTYRVLVLPSGETAAKKNFIVFDAAITANSTDTITLGMTLNAGDKLQIASDSGNVAATAFGSEIA